jgi:hypothetical protein
MVLLTITVRFAVRTMAHGARLWAGRLLKTARHQPFAVSGLRGLYEYVAYGVGVIINGIVSPYINE